jgi:multiple sugar transport system substrate-binding protein
MRSTTFILAAALLLTPCLRADELTVWGRPADNDPAERRLFDQEVAGFQASYQASHGRPIQVRALARRYVQQQFIAAMAGGKGPDVARVWVGAVRTLARLGILAPLDGEIKAWPRAAFIPAPLMQPAQLDGHSYAVPCDSYFQCLLIRRDLWLAAGLDLKRTPANWDELREAARRLTKPQLNQAGLGFPARTDAFLDLLWQAGGEVLRQQPDGRWACAFQENPGLSALSFLRRLRFEDGSLQTNPLASGDEISQLFALGHLGMMVGSPNQLSELILRYGMRPSQVLIAPLPAGPTGIRASHAGGDYLVVNAQASPEARAAAWEYVQSVLSPESQLMRWKGMREAAMPIFPGAFAVDIQVDDPSLALVKEGLPFLRSEPYFERWPLVKDQLDTLLMERAMTDADADLPALLNDSAQRVQQTLLDDPTL